MTRLLLKFPEALPVVFALGTSALLWSLAMDDVSVKVVAAIACLSLCVQGWQAMLGAQLLNQSLDLTDEWKKTAEKELTP